MSARGHHHKGETYRPIIIEDRSKKGEVKRWSRGKVLGKVRAPRLASPPPEQPSRAAGPSGPTALVVARAWPASVSPWLPRVPGRCATGGRWAAPVAGRGGLTLARALAPAQGGFATCYEMKDMATGQVRAGKIVSKANLQKSKSKRKVRTTTRGLATPCHPCVPPLSSPPGRVS